MRDQLFGSIDRTDRPSQPSFDCALRTPRAHALVLCGVVPRCSQPSRAHMQFSHVPSARATSRPMLDLKSGFP
jgi:hypothetical protein